jgi:hypothetical protein
MSDNCYHPCNEVAPGFRGPPSFHSGTTLVSSGFLLWFPDAGWWRRGESNSCFTMFPEKDKTTQEPAPVTIPASSVTVPADPDDDFNESLGERQPGANDAIVCEDGCQ